MPHKTVVNRVEMNRLLRGPDGAVARDLIKRGTRVQSRAKRNLGGGTGSGPKRVDTGLLRATIFNNLTHDVSGNLSVQIGSVLFYAYYVHEGTGLYGPRHARIHPRHRRFLRWEKGGKVFYRRSVKGMRPNHFLTDALPAASLQRSFL